MNNTSRSLDTHYLNLYKASETSRTKSSFEAKKLMITTFKRPIIEFNTVSFSKFGQDTPKIIIGSSRQEQITPQFSPGPGAYNPKFVETKKIPISFPKSQREIKNTQNNDVEMANNRVFPEIKPLTIPNGTHEGFYSVDKTIPGPEYLPPSTLGSRGHKILPKRPHSSLSSDIPGPGHYSPVFETSRPIFFNNNSTPIKPKPGSAISSPGPGQYDPVEFHNSIPKWTIGRKSRLHKIRKYDAPEKPRGRIIGIGSILVSLDSTIDEDEALKYISLHSDIKEVVDEILKEVLHQKPEKPLEYLNHIYTAKAQLINKYKLIETKYKK